MTEISLKDHFSTGELNELHKPSTFQGLSMLVVTWGMIALSFLLVGVWPNVLTWIIALVIIAGRQLALAIIMHEASHYNLHENKKWNDFLGSWLAAYPVWNDLTRYRPYHLRHHKYAGTSDDPDLSLVRGYPTTVTKLIKRAIRDLSGLTAVKRIFGHIMMDLGFIEYTVAGDVKKIPRETFSISQRTFFAVQRIGPVVATNVILYLILDMFAIGWTYGVWLLAYATTFSLIIRWRSIAEHARCAGKPLETRSTSANFFERITVAPHFVNFHAEHHLAMGIPCYKLKAFSQRLPAAINLYREPNYLRVLSQVI